MKRILWRALRIRKEGNHGLVYWHPRNQPTMAEVLRREAMAKIKRWPA